VQSERRRWETVSQRDFYLTMCKLMSDLSYATTSIILRLRKPQESTTSLNLSALADGVAGRVFQFGPTPRPVARAARRPMTRPDERCMTSMHVPRIPLRELFHNLLGGLDRRPAGRRIDPNARAGRLGYPTTRYTGIPYGYRVDHWVLNRDRSASVDRPPAARAAPPTPERSATRQTPITNHLNNHHLRTAGRRVRPIVTSV